MSHIFPTKCPRLESNQHQRLRSPRLYPLSYKGVSCGRRGNLTARPMRIGLRFIGLPPSDFAKRRRSPQTGKQMFSRPLSRSNLPHTNFPGTCDIFEMIPTQSGRRGIRTPDRWLKRPLLYQLSYAPDKRILITQTKTLYRRI